MSFFRVAGFTGCPFLRLGLRARLPQREQEARVDVGDLDCRSKWGFSSAHFWR